LLFPRSQIVDVIEILHEKNLLQKCKNLEGKIDILNEYLIENGKKNKIKLNNKIESEKNKINFSIDIDLFNEIDDLDKKKESNLENDIEKDKIEEKNNENKINNNKNKINLKKEFNMYNIKEEKENKIDEELYLNKNFDRFNQNIYSEEDLKEDFETRISIFYKKIRKNVNSKQPPVVLVRRQNLVLDTCKHFTVLNKDELFKPMYIFFAGEQGLGKIYLNNI
jgi:hypothetical protein